MSERPIEVLLVDDDEAMREALAIRLESWGHSVSLASDGAQAREKAAAGAPDVIVTDVVLPGLSGLDLLEALRADGVAAPVILITAHGDVGWAVKAMKAGAMDFLIKPIDSDHLASLIDRAAVEIRRRDSVRAIEGDLVEGEGRLGHLVGRSRVMREVFRTVRVLAENEASAVLVGESGVGKEVVARTIHDLSSRAERPFVAVNTAAIPEGLVESEVFGHERGAFTGATSARQGCFEQADRGTLLLDEIGDMPLALQPRLLRILEEQKTRRLGGSREVSFDVRVLAATNRDLGALVGSGALREDLLYRLNVFCLEIPPLRAHPEDIDLLSQHFVRAFNGKHGTEVEGVAEEAGERLKAYDWPGNVRELRNILERATILARSGWIEAGHLPPALGEAGARAGSVTVPVGTSAAEAEKRLILETLKAVDGNRTEAARQLGLDPKTIYNKLKSYEDSYEEP